MQRRLGVAFRSEDEASKLVALAVEADSLGLDSFWIAEEYHFRSGPPLAALVAASTKSIGIGLGIVPTHSRHPALTAMEAATLNEIAGGRMILGLGAATTTAARHGVSVGPWSSMRETFPIVRGLLDGKEVTSRGDQWNLEEIRLELPTQRRVPMYIGTFPYSPRMLAAAGAMADGVVLVWCTPESLRHAKGLIAAAAGSAGRDPAHVTTAAYILVSVDADHEAARAACRPILAAYAQRQVRWVEAGLVTQEAITPVIAAYEQGGMTEAIKEVDDHLIDSLAIAGSPAFVRSKLEAFYEAGLDLAIAYQVIGPDQFRSMRLLAELISDT